MRPIRSLLPAVVLACLIAAACGSDSAPNGSSTSAPAAAVSAPAGLAGPNPAASGTAALPTTVASAQSAASGSSPSHPAAILATVVSDWPTYHRDAARSGFDPAFPKPTQGLRIAWRRSLDGAVYGQPLVVGGRLLVATEGDSVYALDPASGVIRWRRHLGTPVPLSSLPCGNIDPLGITGTPVYDPTTRSLFAVAEIGGPQHILFALDPASGAVRWSRRVDPPGIDPRVLQQRAALALGYGRVYVAFGGLDGDCGAYRGTVVGVPASGSGASVFYVVPVAREGGIWGAGGPVLDGAGNVYVSVGNGSSTTHWDGSDSVLRLSSALSLRSSFAPAVWAQDNAADLDLGSTSPTLLPGGWLLAVGKNGSAYLLRQGALGGIGGQRTATGLCSSFGATAVIGSTVYVPCTDGLRQVVVGANGSLHVGWHTASGVDGPPVAGRGAIWGLDVGAGKLVALDPSTGAALVHVTVGTVPHFASPTLWSRSVFLGTMAGITAVAVGP